MAIGGGVGRLVGRRHGDGAVDAHPRPIPGDHKREYRNALGLVPHVAVLPHFGSFGRKWVDSALEGRPSDDVVLLGVDERAAAVWSADGAWRAMGDGAVTLITIGGERRYASGEVIEGLPAPDGG